MKLEQQVNDMSEAEPNEPKLPEEDKPKDLEEMVYHYIALILIISSSLYRVVTLEIIVSIWLALAVFIFVGWVKKMAAIKAEYLLKKLGVKDEEILKLKQRIADLGVIEKKLEEKVIEIVKKINTKII